jgi:SAM-dependent methyltransferase
MNQNVKRVELRELETLWNFKASARFIEVFSGMNLEYFEISTEERDEAILKFIDTLDSDLVKAGPHRSEAWEKGWGENLQDYDKSRDLKDSLPKYFGKIPYMRWKQKWVLPEKSEMEYNLLSLILEYLIEQYISENDSIYEFGCGTGHNLLRIRKVFQKIYLHGLDWATASQSIIGKIAEETHDSLLEASNFDFFVPNKDLKLRSEAVVLTIASLEQTGSDFKDFIDYLIDQKPRLVLHIEPMWEPLDPSKLLDNLSIRYFKKRNYLDGLICYLQEKQGNNQVKIIDMKRSFVGSFFIDGYSIVVWKPN